MRQLFTGMFLVMGTLVACKKEEVGENQKLDPKDQKKYDLMTNQPGSWWMYGGSDSSVCIRRATGRDSTMKGFFFSYYERVDTMSDTKYTIADFFGKNGDRYVNLQDLDGYQNKYVTVVFFKDGVKPGDSWSNIDEVDFGIIKANIRINTRVEETNGTIILNGRQYTDVIRTHNDLYARTDLLQPEYTGIGTLDIWFVQGIGVIKTDMNVDILSGTLVKVYRDSLLDYHLEPE